MARDEALSAEVRKTKNKSRVRTRHLRFLEDHDASKMFQVYWTLKKSYS